MPLADVGIHYLINKHHSKTHNRKHYNRKQQSEHKKTTNRTTIILTIDSGANRLKQIEKGAVIQSELKRDETLSTRLGLITCIQLSLEHSC